MLKVNDRTSCCHIDIIPLKSTIGLKFKKVKNKTLRVLSCYCINYTSLIIYVLSQSFSVNHHYSCNNIADSREISSLLRSRKANDVLPYFVGLVFRLLFPDHQVRIENIVADHNTAGGIPAKFKTVALVDFARVRVRGHHNFI